MKSWFKKFASYLIISVFLLANNSFLSLAHTHEYSQFKSIDVSECHEKDDIVNKDEKRQVKIAVLSDLHYFSPSLGSTGAAFEQYLSGDRKMLAQSDAILKEVIHQISQSDARIVLVAGDLTKDGEMVDHKIVAKYLYELEECGKKVYVINGNHDINNPESVKYENDMAIPIPNVSEEDFLKIYRNFGYREAIERDPNSLSYVVEPIKGLRILAMDSCIYDKSLINKNSIVAGAFPPQRLEWIKKQISTAKQKNIQIIGLMHHGLIQHWSMQESIMSEYVVANWRNVASQLADIGLEFVFTGHSHAQDISSMITEKGNKIYDIESGSLVSFPSPFRTVEVSLSKSHSKNFEKKVKINSNFIQSIDYNLGGVTFPAFAKQFLMEGYYKQIPLILGGLLMSQGKSQDEIAAILLKFKTEQVMPGATALDLIVAAMVTNQQGDEIALPQLLYVYNQMAASQDQTIKLLGQILISLSIDDSPDNNFEIDM